MTLGGLGRLLAVVIAGGSVVGCASGGRVEVERADATSTTPGSPDAGEPVDSVDVAPSTTLPTAPSTSADVSVPEADETPVDREPALGVDDELFPRLGSADLDVGRYELYLDATDPTGTITGRVVVDALVPTDLERVAIDAAGPVVTDVVVDDEARPFEQLDDELLVDTEAADVADGSVSIEIAFRFDARPGESAVGLPIGWIPTPDGAYVLNEPDGASSWLPSNDHPSDEASWRFEIEVTAGHVASANGELIARPDDGEAGVWVWEQAEPMPTYLVHLVVGDYELVDGGAATAADGRSIPLTHVVPRGRADEFAAAIGTIDEMLTFFEDRLGPYPLDRYGLAFVDGLSGLAMETQGRPLFGADDFRAGRLDRTQQLLLSHELAHQWFGNAVGPAAWDDLWLNESLTTYSQMLWLDHIGDADLDRWAEATLLQRQRSSIDATAVPTVENLFGFERYDGGAVTVHALRLEIGDDAFDELLRRWVVDNAGAARTTDDFIALAGEVADTDLAAFFDAWIFSVTPPATFPS